MKTKAFATARLDLKQLNTSGLAFVARFGDKLDISLRSMLVAATLGISYRYAKVIVMATLFGEEIEEEVTQEVVERVQAREEPEPFDDDEIESDEDFVPGNLGPGYIDEDPYENAVDDFLNTPDKITLRAKELLFDFGMALYESMDSDKPMLKSDGSLQWHTRLPWGKRGTDPSGEKLHPTIRRKILAFIKASDPPLFIENKELKLWSIDLTRFPNYAAFEECLSKINL